jgi:HD-GYP domain-containing protein (c-di-GMP phosphodiesterase class II)
MRLIRSRYSYVNIRELLECAGMKEYEVADQGHWFTQEQVDLFYEKLVQMTGNPDIAREAGRHAASSDALGAMRKYVLGLVGAANTFEIIDKTASNFARSSHYKSRKIASNMVEVVVTPIVEGLEKPFQCENRIGFFETIVLMFNHKNPFVQHPECIFKGGQACRYIISWERTHADIFKKVRNIVAMFLALCSLVLLLTGQMAFLKICLPVFLLILLVVVVAAAESEKNELVTSLNNTRDSSDNLLEQININYSNALMTNEVGQALGTHLTSREVLASVAQIMEKRLNYDRGIILLANQEKTRLEIQAGYGYSPDHLIVFDDLSFSLDNPESTGILVSCFREQRPLLVNDLRDVEERLSTRSLNIAREIGSQSFICCPIVCDGETIGVLAVDNVKTKKPLVQSDINLLMGIASVTAISIRNSELIEARLRQFHSVLHVLAASIDARDSLTAGHSEKVTQYALGICRELDLPSEFCEVIRVAALLHDYGKIGVPDTILKKPDRLTDEEYELVKTHVDKTSEILSRINFEGVYREVPEIVRAHHEKLDGSGYPLGLKGDEIPLGSRIISVADYFEAITSKRHYRDPMPVHEAFAILRAESINHLEGRLVEALISCYSRSGFQDVADNYPSAQKECQRIMAL